MIEQLFEVVASLVEFAVEAAGIPIRDRPTSPRVGDRFRAARPANVPAVFRPLTPHADRIAVLVPVGVRCRVELALPAPDNAIYLACLDPLDRLQLSPAHARQALVSGLWLEVPVPVLRSHFQPVRRAL